MAKKILIIEDNDDIREGTAEILNLAGFETLNAKNGKIGIDLAAKHIPDLILCDIMMPELDGYGVLYLLQKNPQLAHIPFIFMTAKAERADMRKGMDMGADDYLTKPFDDVELFNAIESRLKKKNNQSEFKAANGDKNALLQSLKSKGKSRNLDAKQIIYVEDDAPSYLFLVKKGQVKTYKRASDGRELASRLYGDGDFFGYESIVSTALYNENAATLTETELIMVAKADFLDHILHHNETANVFLKLLSGSIRENEEQMLKLAYFSVRKRVADALVKVVEKFHSQVADQCTIKISRDDLAAIVGTASETVSRVLADLKHEKIIGKSGNAINILSLAKLKNVKQ